MLISFIVPLYRVDKYLDECLLSILAGRDKEIEVIAVDDGSPDRSGSIADKYAAEDKRIRVIHKKNEGVSIARNIGVDAAKGDWICFVDGDDKLKPNAIPLMKKYIDKNFDIIVFEHENFDGMNIPEVLQDDKTEIFSREKIELLQQDCLFHEKSSPRFFFYDFGYPWGKLYRREFLLKNQCRFPIGMRKNQDQIFNLICLKYANKILGVHKKIYYYRANMNSISNQKPEKLICDYERRLKEQQAVITNLYSDCDEMKNRLIACQFCTLLLIARCMRDKVTRIAYLKHIDNDLYKDASKVQNRFLNKRQILCKYFLKFRAFSVVAKMIYH